MLARRRVLLPSIETSQTPRIHHFRCILGVFSYLPARRTGRSCALIDHSILVYLPAKSASPFPETSHVEIVEAIDVRKQYLQGEVVVEAVRGIDLVVRKGELLSIIGPSGSGKSTLLTMLGAIETPTSGQILLEGT